MNKPWLSRFTFIGFNITAALDHNRGSNISFQDIYDGLKYGTLFQDLDNKLPNTFDFSLFPHGSVEEAEMIAVLRRVSLGYSGRERRKTGIEHSGLSLLLVCILEAIQQHEWSTPQSN